MPRKPNKILVPKTVSLKAKVTAGGKIVSVKARPGKTKAFAEKSVRMPKGLSPEEQVKWRKKIAHDSEYFIKPLSAKTKKIRRVLEENGIMVEKAIQDLKNGKFLFERAGNCLDSVKGLKLFMENREKTIEKIGRVIRKMHSLGISHNHLHTGNIALTNKGEVILLDFEKARLSEKTITKGEGILPDLFRVSHSLSRLENSLIRLSEERQQRRKREIFLSLLDNYPKEMIRMLKKEAMRRK